MPDWCTCCSRAPAWRGAVQPGTRCHHQHGAAAALRPFDVVLRGPCGVACGTLSPARSCWCRPGFALMSQGHAGERRGKPTPLHAMCQAAVVMGGDSLSWCGGTAQRWGTPSVGAGGLPGEQPQSQEGNISGGSYSLGVLGRQSSSMSIPSCFPPPLRPPRAARPWQRGPPMACGCFTAVLNPSGRAALGLPKPR